MPTLTLPREKRPFCGDDVLIYYDGPMLFKIPVGGDECYLFVALPDDAGPWPFLVVRLPTAVCSEVENESRTLRSAFVGSWERYLLADYGAEVLDLQPISDVPEDWLPCD